MMDDKEKKHLEEVASMQSRLKKLKEQYPHLVIHDGMQNCMEVYLDDYYCADDLRMIADALEPETIKSAATNMLAEYTMSMNRDWPDTTEADTHLKDLVDNCSMAKFLKRRLFGDNKEQSQ